MTTYLTLDRTEKGTGFTGGSLHSGAEKKIKQEASSPEADDGSDGPQLESTSQRRNISNKDLDERIAKGSSIRRRRSWLQLPVHKDRTEGYASGIEAGWSYTRENHAPP